ncbi:uncharacterized protein ALTATR162_LOCUS4420 [Alternaria atra]|uniref:Secreted protein n=1 Tax=Alternaria atra TaxID=119953 RepID=A0A8J2MZ66_9PLEO|nr:uncharacterized protein ALTATR162_LOCUS4420 [Alternaria atra]CAG5156623.1 unnamed protein product [Alternaria atra]
MNYTLLVFLAALQMNWRPAAALAQPALCARAIVPQHAALHTARKQGCGLETTPSAIVIHIHAIGTCPTLR